MELSGNPGFLLHKIGFMMERMSDHVLFENFGIGFSQFKILFALENHGSVQQKDIARSLGQTEASISRQIKLLKQASFIDIAIGKDDRKKRIISLTKKGERVAGESYAILNMFYDPILSILDPIEQKDLMRTLDKVHIRLYETYESASHPCTD